MKKFRFKLATPLRIKRLREKIEKQKFAKAVLTKNRAKNRLVELEQTKNKVYDGIKQNLSISIKSEVLFEYGAYLADLRSAINTQENVIEQAVDAYKRGRESFIESRKERKIYEKIKEKELSNYNIETSKEEQRISDELASTNHSRLERDITNERGF